MSTSDASWGPAVLTPVQIEQVRNHLAEITNSHAFAGSKRTKDFLQLIVEHALAGDLDSLRERMIGAEMFGRPINYDTGTDAVVRVKASEVRRRLAQYYQSLTTTPTVQIDLPTGSYAPQFHWAPVEVPSHPTESANTQLDSVSVQTQSTAACGEDVTITPRWKWKPLAFCISLLAIYSAVLISLGWFASVRS